MSQSANVRSIQAIRDFKVALATFSEDGRNALSSTEMEVRRVRNWLTRDQVSYWQGQIKLRNEQVSIARADLHRRRLSQQGSDAVSDTDQKEALKLAQRRLHEAEEKLKVVKKWIPILEHAISEYHASSQPLGDRLSGSIANSLTLLERMATTLDNYAAIQAKSTEVAVGGLLPEAGPAAAGSSAKTTGPAAASNGDEPATETAVTNPPSADAATTPATGSGGDAGVPVGALADRSDTSREEGSTP